MGNCSRVAKVLHRPASYVCKLFGCEMGDETKIGKKSDICIMNRAPEQQVLMEILQKFIKMFLLSANWNLDKTNWQIYKKGNISQVYAVCSDIVLVNMTSKFCTFNQNHPMEGEIEKSGEEERMLHCHGRRKRKTIGIPGYL